ncbi:MAG: permease-like cell division protein FtsX [Bacteroidales bacterium]
MKKNLKTLSLTIVLTYHTNKMGRKEKNILNGRLIHSYVSLVISIALVLFIVGLAGIIFINAKTVSDYFKENIRITVLLDLDTKEQNASAYAQKLRSENYVKEVKVISKEQGEEEMKNMLGENFMDVLESNPIPISLELKINADYISSDSLSQIKKDIEREPMVKDVVYQESIVNLMNTNIKKVGMILGIFILLLLFISTVIINNTVRLSVYAKRFTIHTMRLVGATKGFIARPFVLQAFFQGLLSALLANLAILVVVNLMKKEFQALFQIIDYQLMFYSLGGVIVVGVVLCMVSTSSVVRGLVNITKDELYY